MVTKFRWQLEEPQLLRDRIASVIRKAIISGELRPGEKISEPELSARLGVSRTPLREAIRVLELDGFLTVMPRRGAFVTEFSIKNIEDIYIIKCTLEGLAARLAVPLISDRDIERMEEINQQLAAFTEPSDSREFFKVHSQFHLVFLRASNNDRLFQINRNLMDHFQRFGIISFSLAGRYQQAVSQHREIVEAFRKRDARMAEKLVYQNVKAGGDALIAELKRREEVSANKKGRDKD